MTREEMREFYERQVEHYKRSIGFSTRHIDWLTGQIENSRKKDKELVEYVWSKGVMAEMDMEIFGTGKYEGDETHKLMLERRREYLRRKKDTAALKKYEYRLANA